MKKTDIRKYILNHFKVPLKECGYKYYSNKFSGQGFEKKTEFGSFQISFGFLDYSTVFYCMPYSSIRFNAVQDIYNEISAIADWGKPFSKTVTKNAFNLNFDSVLMTETGYKIESHSDLIKCADEIENKLIPKIFTWFSSLDSLVKLNKEINFDLFGFSDDERMFKSLIIAFLTKNSRYSEIENMYRQKCVAKCDSQIIAEFEKLISILQNK